MTDAPTDTYDEAQELYQLIQLAAEEGKHERPHLSQVLLEWGEDMRDLLAFGHVVDRDHYVEIRDRMIDAAYELAPNLPVDAGREAVTAGGRITALGECYFCQRGETCPFDHEGE